MTVGIRRGIFAWGNVIATLVILSLVLLSAVHASACTFGRGYFYQVTALKGVVVGLHDHHVFSPRWFRQMFVRKHAKLALYEYRWSWDVTLLVRSVETDDHGNFDFGPLKLGHYTLTIDDDDAFDVEIKDLPRKTDSVTIDVSPVFPDWTGGHEFIARMK